MSVVSLKILVCNTIRYIYMHVAHLFRYLVTFFIKVLLELIIGFGNKNWISFEWIRSKFKWA